MLGVGDVGLLVVLVGDLHGGRRCLRRPVEDWHKIGAANSRHDLCLPEEIVLPRELLGYFSTERRKDPGGIGGGRHGWKVCGWKVGLDVFWKVGSDYHVNKEVNEAANLGSPSVPCYLI
jgi:hypothetical protein